MVQNTLYLSQSIAIQKIIMFLKITRFLFTVLLFHNSYGQLKSPEAFLGYKIGSRYTPHHKVVSYYQHVAENAPGMVKLQQYGVTNEHRPLYLAYVSDASNIASLESIRINNMRLANLSPDRAAPNEQAPAIVWLSYNVHGNETSSSEAGMLTLYALADPANRQTKDWLKNTVIIMDPCVNPDGRDRYINWYNSVVGTEYNADPAAREHREPWPGGRTNHYNFDLNRDWAWQTQVESRQRMKVYNEWMPQIHVDYHEQGINNPYYFAPAAEPYHEVITKWQRDFQGIIGRNHARYFDEKGWLYFTREVFDLFYPSYGDTYPVYNGAIGMTYEQAGGGAAGLGIQTADGDTLTLADRALHHFTTGISTIEIASQNAPVLIKEFRKYFNEAVNGNVGTYKTYIIKNNPQDAERLVALISLLDKNGIRYGTGKGSGKGLEYASRKEMNFAIQENDLLIPAAQPRAAMVKVLFDPDSKLADSATYDITAWALPYAFGLTAYATTQTFNIAPAKDIFAFEPNTPSDAYGYVIKWLGVPSATATAQLLKLGMRLRFAERPFEINGQQFPRGSIIILKNGNEKFGTLLWQQVAAICNQYRIKMNPVNTGLVSSGFDFGSSKVRHLKQVKVALITGEGVNAYAAGEIWHFFDKELQYPVTLINQADLNRVNLSEFDVVIMPDGMYRFLNDKPAAEKLQQWINNGGKLIALEAAVGQLSKLEWSTVSLKKDETKKESDSSNPYESLRTYEDRDRDAIPGTTPGAIMKVAVDNTHPLMYGYPSTYYSLKMDDNVYEFLKDGWNAGVIKKNSQMAGFIGYRLQQKLEDGLVFGVQEMGRGTVVYLTDNILFRDFWENGKLMFCNAVFMVNQ